LISIGNAVGFTRSTSYKLDNLRVNTKILASLIAKSLGRRRDITRRRDGRKLGILRCETRGFPEGRVRVPNIVKRERVFRSKVEDSKIQELKMKN
jgi:hypothetical protein